MATAFLVYTAADNLSVLSLNRDPVAKVASKNDFSPSYPAPPPKVWTEFLKGKMFHLQFAAVILINMQGAFGLFVLMSFSSILPQHLLKQSKDLTAAEYRGMQYSTVRFQMQHNTLRGITAGG